MKTDDLRDIIHQINNHLTAILSEAETVLLGKPAPSLASRMESTVRHVLEPDRRLKGFRSRLEQGNERRT